MKYVYVIGGGTFSHVRSHLALAAPAFGNTARGLTELLRDRIPGVRLILTKMADSTSSLVTNEDVEKYIDKLIADPDTKGIIFNVAMCDYTGKIGEVPSGKYAGRLETRNQPYPGMNMAPTRKIIGKIRQKRKDIYTVGFKTTYMAMEQEQYEKGLKLLKENSLNLVLANDIGTRNNVIIVPEEARYYGGDRYGTLTKLADIYAARYNLTYTRSDVREGPSVDWNGELVPDNLRKVVNHCIERGAYKPFLGKTAGHFAFKLNDNEFVTSKRKVNFNELDKVGLVKVLSYDDDYVIAYGHKPSVGGQSQRIIFKEHKDYTNIVHFHCPLKKGSKVRVKPQWMYECGSHECGKNTSDGLQWVGPMDMIKAVYLENHGPNIVFNKFTNPDAVIKFIEDNFDLDNKTGGTFKNYAPEPVSSLITS